MWYDFCDYGQGCDAAAMIEAYTNGFGFEARASEWDFDGGWLPGGADGVSDSTEVGEDGSFFPPTPDSFD